MATQTDTPRRRNRLLLLAGPALLAPMQVLLFGPHSLFMGNQEEFSAPFWTLAAHLLPLLLAIVTALIAIGLLLPLKMERTFRAYVVWLAAVGLVVWIQGNLLIADYGPLNGEAIDWTAQAWRTPYELTLWLAVPVLGVLAARWLFSGAVFASRLLIATQIILLVFTRGEPKPWKGPPASVFEVSSTRNVIHIVLDAFQSDVFQEIVENERAEMDRAFSGFVFFANHSGAFPTTRVSIPAMLTGSVYRNEEPVKEFTRKQFERASLFATMRKNGYQVDDITEPVFDRDSPTNFYKIPRPYLTAAGYALFAGWQLADLSLFRHSPHVLKPAVYNDENWRLQSLFGQSAENEARGFFPVNGQAFLAEFANNLKIGHDRPLYKFVHVGVTHWPVVLGADCRFVGTGRTNRVRYYGQARCAVRRVTAIMDKLRELGVYDNSLIVISSDHGLALPARGFSDDREEPGMSLARIAGSALSLLVVKPPHAAGSIRISRAPTTISDIPATIMGALGLPNTYPGMPALTLADDTPRARTFASYIWKNEYWSRDYLPLLDIYSIDGNMLDADGWRLSHTIFAPDAEIPNRSWGLFDVERSKGGIEYRWSGPRVALSGPPGASQVELTFRSVAPQPQTVKVQVDGAIVDRMTLTDQQWVTRRYPITRPPGAASKTLSPWLELYVDPTWRPRRDRRRLGVMTRDIKWN